MTLLTLDQLSVAIDGTPILRGVNLTIEAGESVGLVGESGSGKSMTALAIMGLLPEHAQCSGGLRFQDRDLTTLSERDWCALRGAEIGMVFQEPMTALNPLKPIGEQIAEVCMVHQDLTLADALDRARQLMDRVGLQSIPAHRYPHELSGGQRQRIVIACAIACRPKLVIADEPTSALDVTTQAQILTLLRDVTAEQGAALLLISHDLAVVAAMTDRIAVMQQGAIVEQGPTEEFFGTMKHPYSRALYKAATHRPDRTSAIPRAPFFEARHCTRIYRAPGLFAAAKAPIVAVSNVSFAIAPGESVGLVGESGSGKSTLARALLGLDPLAAGDVVLGGQAIDMARRAERLALRRKVQLVFQDPFSSFDPRRTIGWSIAEPLALLPTPLSQAECTDRVAQTLASVELTPDFAHRYPHQMSGGQRQRAAIARALITQPDLIVLDEPVSALDVSVRERILDVLAALQDKHHVAYLFITHDLSLLRAVTDRALVMQHGQIVEEGRTADVLDRPQHPYTQALVAAAPDLDKILAARAKKPV